VQRIAGADGLALDVADGRGAADPFSARARRRRAIDFVRDQTGGFWKSKWLQRTFAALWRRGV